MISEQNSQIRPFLATKGFVSLLTSLTLVISCGGRKKDVTTGEELNASEYVGGKGVVSSAQPQSVTTGSAGTTVLVDKCTTKTLPLPVFDIVPVIQIVEATTGIAGWDFGPGGISADNSFPFTGPVKNIGEAVSDGQVGFEFNFTYPANNYQFTQASIVVDTSRDTSDTEGIFVDGVFSGVPPNMVNTLSPNISNPVYSTAKGALGGTSENSYYNDFSLSHYKNGETNSFNLDLKDLLSPTSKTAKSVLTDGNLKVVLGDDSPALKAFLVIRGLTISSDALSCETSDEISFTNVYLHNDGNTTGEVAFSGTISNPYTSWSAPGTYNGFEMNFDAPLPQAAVEDINLDTASLRFTAKTVANGAAAIVINGIGFSTSNFDRSQATAVVEEWEDAATTSFETFMAGVSTASSGTANQIDLISYLGHDRMRDLLSQGKLNIAVQGDLLMKSTQLTSTRTVGTQVGGPELVLNGTYTVRICNVPNNPNSPLSENGFVPPEPEEVTTCEKVAEEVAGTETTTVLNDGAGPAIGSIQVLEITSTEATIVWPTDEGSSSQVAYGVVETDQSTNVDSNLTTFHQVHLTGLSPYKYYIFKVISADKYGNQSVSQEQRFRTLR